MRIETSRRQLLAGASGLAGAASAAAGVGTLVNSHYVQPDDPEVTDAMWLEAARTHFAGRIALGKDLLEI